MEFVSVGALLLNRATEEHPERASTTSSSTTTTTTTTDDEDDDSSQQLQQQKHRKKHHHHHHHHGHHEDADDDDMSSDDSSTYTSSDDDDDDEDHDHQRKKDKEGDEKTADGTVVHFVRAPLIPHADLHKDSTPPSAYYKNIFYPEVYMPIFYALRVTLLVGLPLGFLARYPKTMAVFPAHVIMPLFGIVDTRFYAGEQIAFWIASCQNAIWFMLWGTLNNIFNTHDHTSAWWCTLIFGVFVVSLFGDVRCKRICVLTTALMMEMQHMPGGTTLKFPPKVCRDVVISASFALLQAFVPPRTVSRECDDMLASGWAHLSRIVRTAATACWSDDPIESTIALSRMSTEPVRQIQAVLPQRLFYVMYEFWESTLRLELRRDRLELQGNFRPAIHALTDTARTLVVKRPFTINARRKEEPAGPAEANSSTSAGTNKKPSRATTTTTFGELHSSGEGEESGDSSNSSLARRPYGNVTSRHRAPVVEHQHQPYGRQNSATYEEDHPNHSEAEEDAAPLPRSSARPARRRGADSSEEEGEADDSTTANTTSKTAEGKDDAATEEEAVPVYFQAVRRSVSRIFGVNIDRKPANVSFAALPTSSAPPAAAAPGGKRVKIDEASLPSSRPSNPQQPSTKDALAKKKKKHHYPHKKKRSRSGGSRRDQDHYTLVHWKKSKEIVQPDLLAFLDAFEAVTKGLGKHLMPEDVTAHVPFQQLREAADQLHRALNKLHFELLIRNREPVNPILYTSTMFFHLSLINMAQGLLRYGELMRNFDRRRYKSGWRRFFEFFFLDYWNAFWEDLPNRVTLATPRDLRIVKDAIKMALSYGVGAMYTMYMDPENTYYFGMAILMGVGWPTAGDTMVASVYRITGMVIACSIAYVAIWHTPNLAGELAIALAGVFIAQLFRDVMPYAHTAIYCSMLLLTALNSAGTKLVLLSRIVSNSFTVMTYYVICVFFFPINVLRVTYAHQVRSVMFVTDTFSQLVRLMQVPVDTTDPDERDAVLGELKLLAVARKKGWGTITTFGMWIPKAAAEPTLHGQPYPLAEMNNVLSSLRRLASAVDIVYSALLNLYQPHANGMAPQLIALMNAITPIMIKMDENVRIVMQDFIDAFAVPFSWTAENATKNFTEFLAINEDLHKAFYTSHKQMVRTFLRQFHESVVSRTMQRAAEKHLITPDLATSFALARGTHSHNASFFLPTASSGHLPVALAAPEGNQSSQPREGEHGDEEKDEEGNVVAPRDHPLQPQGSGITLDAGNTSGQPSMLDNESLAQALEPLERLAEADAYEEFIGQRTNMSFAPPPTAAAATSGTMDGTNHTATGSDAGEPPALSNQRATSVRFDLYGLREVEEERDPAALSTSVAQQQAPPPPLPQQPPQRQVSFIRAPPRPTTPETPSTSALATNVSMLPAAATAQYGSVSLDVEMITSLMVAADMFFAESERLLRTMYKLNAYSRSRDGPPVKISPLQI